VNNLWVKLLPSYSRVVVCEYDVQNKNVTLPGARARYALFFDGTVEAPLA
jgi:hypothetical protein